MLIIKAGVATMHVPISRVAALGVALFLGWIEFNSIAWYVADRHASGWPVVQGIITAHQSCLPVHACGVSYSFRVADQELQAHRISFAPAHLPKGWGNTEMRQWADQEFPVGHAMPVHYDPANPENAALQVGVLSVGYLVGPGAIALLLVGMVAWAIRGLLQARARPLKSHDESG
jgi:hypothetical protein